MFCSEGGIAFIVYELLYVGFVFSIAVLLDLYCDRISNHIILMGFCGILFKLFFEIIRNGFNVSYLIQSIGGCLVPLVCLFPLFYFHMMGAGDIKLLMVAGGFVGLRAVPYCLFISVVVAAVISLYKMIKYHLFQERFAYFSYYMKNYLNTKERKFYYDKELSEECKVHFSVPAAISVMLVYIILLM